MIVGGRVPLLHLRGRRIHRSCAAPPRCPGIHVVPRRFVLVVSRPIKGATGQKTALSTFESVGGRNSFNLEDTES